jgi:hypothetical protein
VSPRRARSSQCGDRRGEVIRGSFVVVPLPAALRGEQVARDPARDQLDELAKIR